MITKKLSTVYTDNTMYLFKDSLIEKLLEFFIAVIYTELLKTVDLKIFYKQH